MEVINQCRTVDDFGVKIQNASVDHDRRIFILIFKTKSSTAVQFFMVLDANTLFPVLKRCESVQ